jgi:hypothetical protein
VEIPGGDDDVDVGSCGHELGCSLERVLAVTVHDEHPRGPYLPHGGNHRPTESTGTCSRSTVQKRDPVVTGGENTTGGVVVAVVGDDHRR